MASELLLESACMKITFYVMHYFNKEAYPSGFNWGRQSSWTLA